VPASLRQEISGLGLCRDEYNRSDHWPGQLYVRTALRIVGQTVLTQADVTRTTWVDREDTIGVASYTVDIPGPVQTIVVNGEVYNEGALKVCVDRCEMVEAGANRRKGASLSADNTSLTVGFAPCPLLQVPYSARPHLKLSSSPHLPSHRFRTFVIRPWRHLHFLTVRCFRDKARWTTCLFL